MVERNLIAHVGFERSSVIVDLYALGVPEDAGRAGFLYGIGKPSWRHSRHSRGGWGRRRRAELPPDSAERSRPVRDRAPRA